MANFAEAGVKFVAQGVDKFISSVNRAGEAAERFDARVQSMATSANQTITSFGNFGDSGDEAISSIDQVTESFSTMGRQADDITNRVLPALAKGVAIVTLSLGALVGAGIATAVSFESAFADVTKTVDTFVDRAGTAATGIIQLTTAGEEFKEAITDLSTEIPVTFEELSAIAGLGGQLGIIKDLAGDDAKEALLSFTETVAGLGEATNLTQEKAATGLAQISNIFRETVDDIGLNVERLGSTIVFLGNTSAATESLILNFSQRIAGAGRTIGLTQAEVLGIGTAFASIGITAEAGSTAVNRALLIMNEAVANSSDKFADNTTAIEDTASAISDLQADLVRLEAQTGLGEGGGASLVAQKEAWIDAGKAAEDFGRTLGDTRREQLFKTQTEIDRLSEKLRVLKLTQGQALTTEVFDELLRVVQLTAAGADQTAESFKDLFRDDPAEAFTMFVEGLAIEGDAAGETLDRIGLGSVEATRAFLAMAGASDLVRDSILGATEAFQANSALTNEVSIRYATLKSNAEELWNALRALGENVFSVLMPNLSPLVEWGKDIIEVLRDELPGVIESLQSKIGPEIEEAYRQLFGGGMFSGDAITTPEGYLVSGELIGVEAQSVTRFREDLENLQTTVDEMDFSGLSDTIVATVEGLQATWQLFIDNIDLVYAAVDGLITVLGATFLISAMQKAGTAVAFLSTPLGQLSIALFAINLAWETNWLDIQTVTSTTIENITQEIDDFVLKLEEVGLPELDTTMLTGLGTAGAAAARGLGELVTLVVSTPLAQVSSFVDLIVGLGDSIKNIAQMRNPVMFSDFFFDDRLTIQARLQESLAQAVSGAMGMFTAPIVKLSELIGFDFDTSGIEKMITDRLFFVVNNVVLGFLSAISGEDFSGVELSFMGLFDALIEFSETQYGQDLIETFTGISTALTSFGTALMGLFVAIDNLLGGIDWAQVFQFAGAMAAFVTISTIEGLTNLVTQITALVIIFEGLLNLDFGRVVEGLTKTGTALLNYLIIPLRNLDQIFFDGELEEKLKAGVDNLTKVIKEKWDDGFVTIETGQAVSNWIVGIVNNIGKGSDDIVTAVQNLFLFGPGEIKVDFVGFELAQSFSDWLVGVVDHIGKGSEDIIAAVQDLFTFGPDDIKIDFIGFEIGQKISDWIKGIVDQINKGSADIIAAVQDLFRTDDPIDLGMFGFLADWGVIDISADTEGMGTDIAKGAIDELEAEETTWRDSIIDFFVSPIDLAKEELGIQSASTVTEAMAQDLILGYAKGLSDLTPIEEAMIGVDSTLLSTFTTLSDSLTQELGPSITATDNLFISFYSDTLPRTTSAIADDLIPAKEDLVDVNIIDLVPSVEELILSEERLDDVLQDVRDTLQQVIDRKIRDRDKSKDLIKQVDLLTESYLGLAEAIGKASEAGGPSTVPSVPGSTTPGAPFQKGGSFIVPSNIGPEGLPIRVHANELVQIVPASLTRELMAIPVVLPKTVGDQQVSGATINNSIQNQTNTSSLKEYHLHVSEAPTSDVKDSFELLEELS